LKTIARRYDLTIDEVMVWAGNAIVSTVFDGKPRLVK